MAQTPDLIGSVEAARILNKSPRTIHRLVESGILKVAITAPGGRVGVYLYKRADVEKLAKAAA